MEGSNLTVVDLNTKDFLRQMGNCIQYGLPCLLQVHRAIDNITDENKHFNHRRPSQRTLG